jgi:hypothetical protein
MLMPTPTCLGQKAMLLLLLLLLFPCSCLELMPEEYQIVILVTVKGLLIPNIILYRQLQIFYALVYSLIKR